MWRLMTVNVGKIRHQPSVTSLCIFDCHFANPAAKCSTDTKPNELMLVKTSWLDERQTKQWLVIKEALLSEKCKKPWQKMKTHNISTQVTKEESLTVCCLAVWRNAVGVTHVRLTLLAFAFSRFLVRYDVVHDDCVLAGRRWLLVARHELGCVRVEKCVLTHQVRHGELSNGIRKVVRTSVLNQIKSMLP